MKPSHDRNPVLRTLGAVVLVLALSGCGRALPTSPDPDAASGLASASRQQASTNGMVTPDAGEGNGASGGSITPPVVFDPGGDAGDDPVAAPQPTLPVFERSASASVKPNRETTVRAGRWTVTVPRHALTGRRTVTIDVATDGSLRAQLSPAYSALAQAAVVTIDYSGTKLDPSAPGYVTGSVPTFFRYDSVSRRWVVVASTNDAAHRLVRVSLTRLGIYGVGTASGW